MFFTYLYVCAPSVYSTSEGHKRVLDALEEQPCTQVRHVSECTFFVCFNDRVENRTASPTFLRHFNESDLE